MTEQLFCHTTKELNPNLIVRDLTITQKIIDSPLLTLLWLDITRTRPALTGSQFERDILFHSLLSLTDELVRPRTKDIYDQYRFDPSSQFAPDEYRRASQSIYALSLSDVIAAVRVELQKEGAGLYVSQVASDMKVVFFSRANENTAKDCGRAAAICQQVAYSLMEDIAPISAPPQDTKYVFLYPPAVGELLRRETRSSAYNMSYETAFKGRAINISCMFDADPRKIIHERLHRELEVFFASKTSSLLAEGVTKLAERIANAYYNGQEPDFAEAHRGLAGSGFKPTITSVDRIMRYEGKKHSQHIQYSGKNQYYAVAESLFTAIYQLPADADQRNQLFGRFIYLISGRADSQSGSTTMQSALEKPERFRTELIKSLQAVYGIDPQTFENYWHSAIDSRKQQLRNAPRNASSIIDLPGIEAIRMLDQDYPDVKLESDFHLNTLITSIFHSRLNPRVVISLHTAFAQAAVPQEQISSILIWLAQTLETAKRSEGFDYCSLNGLLVAGTQALVRMTSAASDPSAKLACITEQMLQLEEQVKVMLTVCAD